MIPRSDLFASLVFAAVYFLGALVLFGLPPLFPAPLNWMGFVLPSVWMIICFCHHRAILRWLSTVGRGLPQDD